MSGALFDEEDAPAIPATNYLVVPPTIPAGRLEAYENQFRRDKRRHYTIFVEDDPVSGEPIFLNVAEFRTCMQMTTRNPTLADAANWLAGATPWEG